MRYWYQEPDISLAKDALLEAYINGRLSAPLHVMLASGSCRYPAERKLARSLDHIKGTVLDCTEPLPIKNQDQKLEELLAIIDNEEKPSFKTSWDKNENKPEPLIKLPFALMAYIGEELSLLQWEELKPGVEIAKIDRVQHTTGALVRIAQGASFDVGKNNIWQLSLVLSGAVNYEFNTISQGYIIFSLQGNPEKITALSQEDCWIYTVWCSEEE